MSPVIDTLLDRSLVLGYTRIGPAVRSRLRGWPADPPPDALAGRHVAVTGATGGLGVATVHTLLDLGAHVDLVVRDPAKVDYLHLPADRVTVHRCDVADLDDVRRFAGGWGGTLDAVVHNAGAMPPERTESPQGHELTMALHVLGPVLMTELLRDSLAEDARVLFVTSGGMYGQKLRDDDPEYLRGEYSPTTAYARSKRAQVELLPVLTRRWSRAVYATHPGWANTPGVTESLPTFDKVMGPLLRTAEQGADTTVWLTATRPEPPGGTLWHDRRARPTHYLGRTRPAPGAVQRFWDWTVEQTGLEQ